MRAGERARVAWLCICALFHREVDVLLTPTLPITAFETGLLAPAGSDQTDWTGWTPFSSPLQFDAAAAASIPVRLHFSGPAGGTSDSGRQISGRSGAARRARIRAAVPDKAAPALRVEPHGKALRRHVGLRFADRIFAEMEDRGRKHRGRMTVLECPRPDGRECRRLLRQ